jgi:hypothetical protein
MLVSIDVNDDEPQIDPDVMMMSPVMMMALDDDGIRDPNN